VPADAAPDDGLHALEYLGSVLPGRPPVAIPGQLEDAGRAADTLHAKAGAEAPASGAQVVDERSRGLAEAAALGGCEAVKVGGEPGGPRRWARRTPPGSPKPPAGGRGRWWLFVLKGVGDVVLSHGGLSGQWCVGARLMTVESVGVRFGSG
jgi:hypothetical protein